jgi:REP element-mobilizing transposase RayT
VTICTHNKIPFFGRVVDRKMVRNQFGEIVQNHWNDLPNHYKTCVLDEFIVMPNHVHGVIHIDRSIVGNGFKPFPTHTLSEIIRGFKTFSSKKIHENKLTSFQWQKSFYDHIIRSEIELLHIQKYIRYNPLKWGEDEYYKPNNLI